MNLTGVPSDHSKFICSLRSFRPIQSSSTSAETGGSGGEIVSVWLKPCRNRPPPGDTNPRDGTMAKHLPKPHCRTQPKAQRCQQAGEGRTGQLLPARMDLQRGKHGDICQFSQRCWQQQNGKSPDPQAQVQWANGFQPFPPIPSPSGSAGTSPSFFPPPMAPASLGINSLWPPAPLWSWLKSGSPQVPTVGFAARQNSAAQGRAVGRREHVIWPEGLRSRGNSKTRVEGDPNEGWHKQGLGHGGTAAVPYHCVIARDETSQSTIPALAHPDAGNFNPLTAG